ncbi:MAG: plasmid mobilization relaxosome protein MobC [Candidatus Pelethousia sp.]|nr:plasmid mobilization relaxosome protein MobC [Candidatus Pelethousia sp.]
MANRKRNIVLRVPVTAEERTLIEQKMKLLYTGNFSAYARKMLIDGYIINVDYSDIKAQTAEIQKIGVNVNQIAKRVNATGTVYAQDIEDIKGALNEIWRLQRLSLLKAP